MLTQLGSMPFSREYLAEDTVGHWVIEADPGEEPRMYADDIMLGLIGLKEQTDPAETYRAWFRGIDRSSLESVRETERLNTQGVRAEVVYPWHYPDGRVILVRCEGIRNFAYTRGVRTEGRHRNITDLTVLQKQEAVIRALSADFECVNYILINEDKKDDVVIPFRTSPRIKALIPGWAQETSFHNKLKMLIENVGFADDIDKFYAQTRREVILGHLEHESAYFVNARAVTESGRVEYFQLKFTADRDEEGQLIGLVVGIHSVDEEMREELTTRQRIEELIAEKTSELNRKNRTLSRTNERIIRAIGDIVEGRDEESGGHIARVSSLTRALALQVMKDLPEYGLTMKEVTAITTLSPLHDVGKIRIPDSILLKPGRLTPEEFEVMKTHCDRGCEILRTMLEGWDRELPDMSLDICRYHHEKWDGGGYPCGLKGDEIPIAAQIVSIADVYDALVSKRCYKDAYAHDTAFSMIMEGQCGKFSDKLLSCLAKCRDAFAESGQDAAPPAEEPDGSVRTEGIEYISGALPLVAEISESMPGGFFIYQADSEEKLIYFNDIMVDYFGCSSRAEFAEHVGNSFRGIVHPDDYAQVEKEIFSQINGDSMKLDHVVYRITRRDGSVRWLDDYGRLIRSGDMGNVFFVFVTDCTEAVLGRQTSAGEDPAAEADAPEGSTAAALCGLKILLADDSGPTRVLYRELLEQEGAAVDEAVNGFEAVSAVRQSMDYELILMDIVMPVMSGISATREIVRLMNAAGKRADIICITSEGTDMQIREALEAGARECLYKPLDMAVLARKLRETGIPG